MADVRCGGDSFSEPEISFCLFFLFFSFSWLRTSDSGALFSHPQVSLRGSCHRLRASHALIFENVTESVLWREQSWNAFVRFFHEFRVSKKHCTASPGCKPAGKRFRNDTFYSLSGERMRHQSRRSSPGMPIPNLSLSITHIKSFLTRTKSIGR